MAHFSIVAGGYFVNVERCPRGLNVVVGDSLAEVKGEDLGGRSCRSRDCEELM